MKTLLVSINGNKNCQNGNFFHELSDIYTGKTALCFSGACAAFQSLASTFKVRVGRQTAACRQVRIEEAAGAWEPLGPAPAWFTQCACLIWTWTITQLKKGKHIFCGSFEVDQEEQEPRRCAGLFCISSHLSLMCRSGRWSGARAPTGPENSGLDSKSLLHFFHALRRISGLRCFILFFDRFSITIWWQEQPGWVWWICKINFIYTCPRQRTWTYTNFAVSTVTSAGVLWYCVSTVLGKIDNLIFRIF